VRLFALAFSCILIPTVCAGQTASPKQTATPRIRGKVLQEPGGQPIRKADVQLNGREGTSAAQYSAITDGEGQFTIDDVQPGRYVVVVEHPGFVQSSGGKRPATILLLPGSGKTDFIFHMQPAAVITGKIVDIDGDAMGGVGVTAIRAGSVPGPDVHSFGNGTTNDLGEFRIPGLRAGRYKVSATPPQNLPSQHADEGGKGKEQVIYTTTYYPGTLVEEQAVAVEVHLGSETPITFGVLTSRAFRVAGTVAGLPSGASMTQIMLETRGGSGGAGDAPQSLGDGGHFEFSNVLPGSYDVQLVIVTFGGGQPSMQMLRLGQPIEVRDANVEGLRLQPEPAGQVRGKFRLDTGQKFDWTQLTVVLVPLDGQQASGVFAAGSSAAPAAPPGTNADGTFELKNVSGGTYLLVIGAKSNTLRDYYTKSVELGGREVADSGFMVGADTYLDVTVSAKGASIEETVVDGHGQPVPYATVVSAPSAEHRTRPDLYQRDTTDVNGHFSLRGLNPGKYTVLAFDELQEDVRQPEFLKSYGTRGENVELEEGARKSIVLKLIVTDSEGP
jgi:hypothetical protein